MPLTPILTAHWDEPDSHTIEGYRRHGGYDMVPVSFGARPDDVIALVAATAAWCATRGLCASCSASCGACHGRACSIRSCTTT